jgi:ribonuclease HI
MEAKLLGMEIMKSGCEPALINITDKYGNYFSLHYFRSQNKIHYLEQNTLSQFGWHNESQILKILNSKRDNSFFKGFHLGFVIIPKFYFVQNKDFNNYIAVDRTNDIPRISVKSTPAENFHEIYTDGSYFNLDDNTGFAYIIRYPEGEEKLYQEKINNRGNNIAELSAVASALERLTNADKIRIYTDSRYVIKGLTQWIHYWKVNHWRTVHNEDVKYKEIWIACEKHTNNKNLEFKWIKSHSHHFENSLCDMMAKEAANKE